MAYKKVSRVVTVEFVKEQAGKAIGVRITPEQIVVRYGDTIVWDVQGLTPAMATRIAIGNFLPIEVPGRIRRTKKGLMPYKLRRVSREDVRVKAVGARFQAKLDLGQADLGLYKYDVKADGETLIDPDVEIRGPKR